LTPIATSRMHQPPHCPCGTTWDKTVSEPPYDTPSGDLEIGQYALQEDGTFIVNYPATTYTDACRAQELDP
jgi:hypothetical protein